MVASDDDKKPEAENGAGRPRPTENAAVEEALVSGEESEEETPGLVVETRAIDPSDPSLATLHPGASVAGDGAVDEDAAAYGATADTEVDATSGTTRDASGPEADAAGSSFETRAAAFGETPEEIEEGAEQSGASLQAATPNVGAPAEPSIVAPEPATSAQTAGGPNEPVASRLQADVAQSDDQPQSASPTREDDGTDVVAPSDAPRDLFDVSATTDRDEAADAVREDAAVGDRVGITAFAQDGDADDDVVYTLSQNPGGAFAVDAVTGVVTVADPAALDFETAPTMTIEVTATSSDGSINAQSFDIAVEDVVEAISLQAGDQGETLIGDALGDTLTGGAGDDRLQGGAGDDVIDGGSEARGEAIGEAGHISVSQDSADQWHRVSFDGVIDDAVVVMTANSANGGDPYTVRVRNVTDEGFEFQIDEWDYLDGRHVEETLSWMAVSEGVHTLENGMVIEAGSFTGDDSWTSTEFTADFQNKPAVFSQVSSDNIDEAVASRTNKVTSEGFQTLLQGEESHRKHGEESVDWIAIDFTGADMSGMFGATDLWTEDTHKKEHRDATFDVSFGDGLDGAPVVIADDQTYRGGDSLSLIHI